MTTISKPVELPAIALTSTGVSVLSPPPADTDIVIAGDTLSFRLHLAINGTSSVVAMYASQPVEVSHSIEEVETGTRFQLGPFPFTTPATNAALNAGFEFTTGPFASGLNTAPPAVRFRTAAGDDDGVYRVVTEFHFKGGPSQAKANAVFDDRILAITAP